MEHHALGDRAGIDVLLGPLAALNLTPEERAVFLPTAEQHEYGVLAALHIVHFPPHGFQFKALHALGALVDAGEHGHDVRPQHIEGMLPVNLVYPGNKVLLGDLHIVVQNHRIVRGQLALAVADAIIIAPGKAGVLLVEQNGNFLIALILRLQRGAGAVGGSVVHNDDVLAALQGLDTFHTFSGIVNGTVMKDNEGCHRLLSPFLTLSIARI